MEGGGGGGRRGFGVAGEECDGGQAPWFQRTCETRGRPHGGRGQISVTGRMST